MEQHIQCDNRQRKKAVSENVLWIVSRPKLTLHKANLHGAFTGVAYHVTSNYFLH